MVLFCLSSCGVQTLDMNDRSAVVSGITVEQDDYTKVTSVRGPSITEPNQTGYIQWGTKDY